MKLIRDHYFGAWINITKEIEFNISDKGLEFDITQEQYDNLLLEYKKIQPIFKKIRSIVKQINDSKKYK